MKLTAECLRLSATDLAHHLACRHLTRLDLAAAREGLRPPHWRDPDVDVLEERGLRHERAYLDHLRGGGLEITELRGEGGATAVTRTLAAMQSGAQVIVQATLARGRWLGRADVLLRVAAPSELGAWSYEVVDTKLARDTRASAILQLCLYSELVGAIQGRLPDAMHVVSARSGFEPQSFRLHDLIYYYRRVKRRLEVVVDSAERGATYPEPVSHCDICRWWPRCDAQRRADDHLSLVAGISGLQRHELERWPVTTLASLAEVPLPLPQQPRRGSREGYERIREQARIQLEGRHRNAPVHELLDREPGRGLARLPPPDAGDLYIDFEGDPFAGESGLEYLFGYCDRRADYTARWAFDAAGERAGFEWLVDLLCAHAERYPDAHYYHFAPYEPAALRRVMGRHASREAQVDGLLRAERFIDLHAIVKQSLRASVERYSIKDLEAFYGYARDRDLREASRALREVERALELDGVDALSEEVRGTVEAYNRDDCRSALRLHDWLERLRTECFANGEAIARPPPQGAEPPQNVSERQRRVAPVKAALLRGLPDERTRRTESEQARWLLAELLEWHAREAKAPWWEYFRLRELSEDELREEKSAISGLDWIEHRPGGTPRCPIDRYRFPPQNTLVRAGHDLHTTDDGKFGIVEAIDIVERTVDVKKTGATRDLHPGAVFAHTVVLAREQPESLLDLGVFMAGSEIDTPGARRAARDLLLGRAPRLRAGAVLRRPDEDALATARRLALDLEDGVLAIQGPPGSGKTYTGARMICELVRAGRQVGVTAVSHKVIRNLLDATLAAAREEGLELRCVHKVGDEVANDTAGVLEVSGNAPARAALMERTVMVAGGTSWMWSREDFAGAVDVLFVDEAGQMALADVLASARGARSVVLLGDPQQLEQPQQGSHPEGTNVSALEHLLAGALTLPDDRGLFLEETWRLHPALCDFTSEIFYEGRLHSRPGLERQAIAGDTAFAGAGLSYVPVEHEGNQSASPEEAERVGALVAELVRPGVSWIDARGNARPITLSDVLIVAPYNAQVAEIARRIPGARVGTVDKFQGQEAAVVIYSMATSSPEDAPRGMEFLYSGNRLNVATSRARCACILVASPRLFEPECQTPRQMRLANAFCRYLELARTP